MKILVEQCQKININELVRGLKTEVAKMKLKEKIDLLDQDIEITHTPCHFSGHRFWFICPGCKGRVGTLYKKPTSHKLMCRKCHNLRYMKSRFNKMM